MDLNFLPEELTRALRCLNLNYLSEIRIRKGQPVIIEYFGEYVYISDFGKCVNSHNAMRIYDVEKVLSAAMKGSVYAYSEQLKSAFITLDGGIRVGIGGEYVTEKGIITAVRCVTSLNIRIPHDVAGCAHKICDLFRNYGLRSTLLFSKPGLGKTTMLRDIAKDLGGNYNVLVFDERGEISAMNSEGVGYDMGERCDVVRGNNKLAGFRNAIRAMKPQIIITDELYGEDDIMAVKYAVDCGLTAIASTHVTDRSLLAALPFDCYVELIGIGKEPVIYDKNFDIISNNRSVDGRGISSFDE